MENVRRIYVEKKTGYAVKAQELKEDLIGYLNMSGIEDVRMFIRYDVENISDEVFEQACRTVFSEPPVDILYRETIEIPANGRVFSVEYLPGQFDQRADSAVQCVQFLKAEEQPIIRTAVTYLITGDLTDEEFDTLADEMVPEYLSGFWDEDSANGSYSHLWMDAVDPDAEIE